MADEDQDQTGAIDTGDGATSPAPTAAVSGGGGGAIPDDMPPVLTNEGGVQDDATGVDEAQVKQLGGGAFSTPQRRSQNVGSNLARLIMGEGAVSPDVLDQLRQGYRGTPADTGVYAIHDAMQKHGPDAALAVVQGMRNVYDTANALAYQAMQKGNLQDAISNANKAQENMPDGANVIFSPNGNSGVIAVAQIPGQKETIQYNLTPEQFANFVKPAGDAQFDKAQRTTVPALLQQLTNAASSGAGSAPQAQGQQTTGFEADSDQTPQQQTQKKARTAGAALANPDGDDDDDARYDAALTRANRLFPRASQGAERSKYIAEELKRGDAERQQTRVTKLQGENQATKATITGDAGVKKEDVKGQHGENMTERKAKAWEHSSDQKLEGERVKAKGREDHENRVDQREAQKLGQKSIATTQMTGGKLSDDQKALQKNISGAANKTYSGQGAAPQVQAPTQVSSIPAGAINMLKSDPRLRDQFDAKFGAGAAARVLGQ